MDFFEKYLKGYISEKRFEHSMRVAETANRLAAAHRIPVEKSYLAGILHDVARDFSAEQLQGKIREFSINPDVIEAKEPVLLHGRIGALMVEKELGITDGDILQSIARHTTAGPGMTQLDKIIFAADFLEPGRQIPVRDGIYRVIEADCQRGYWMILQAVLKYVAEKGFYLHRDTVMAWNEAVETSHMEERNGKLGKT
ncbi:MAG: bis(5'-nucleosyl)-tetraphosphatase (symmetrical) YqeK [Bacillota bacterium]